MNSEYQTKKNAEGSQGEYKRIYEEYDEGEQSHAQVEGKDRRTHYVRVHKTAEQPDAANATKKNGVVANGTSSGTATTSGDASAKDKAGKKGEDDPKEDKDHDEVQSSAQLSPGSTATSTMTSPSSLHQVNQRQLNQHQQSQHQLNQHQYNQHQQLHQPGGKVYIRK